MTGKKHISMTKTAARPNPPLHSFKGERKTLTDPA